jgi:hypothetical protein
VTTDRLIGVLSANLEPVAQGELRRTIILALVSGGAAAFGLMLITVGLRSEIGTVAHLKWLALKLLFAMSLIVIGVPPLIKSLRPGQDDSIQLTQVSLCVLVISVAAIAIQLLSPAYE